MPARALLDDATGMVGMSLTTDDRGAVLVFGVSGQGMSAVHVATAAARNHARTHHPISQHAAAG